MISEVVLRSCVVSAREQRAVQHALRQLRDELACSTISCQRRSRLPGVCLTLEEWAQHEDLLGYDRLIHRLESEGDFTLTLSCRDWQGIGAEAAFQVLSRYQRLLPVPPRVLQQFLELPAILAAHRELHSLDLPLVRADYDHALDTWRWLLRLSPDAGPALQLAALLHDLERLESEPLRRIEQYASDYGAFKQRHAAGSARSAATFLARFALPERVTREACELIVNHERPGEGRELTVLNDADALSFFSLNSWGYLRYFGVEQTRHKVAYTLARMSNHAFYMAFRTRQPVDISAMMQSIESESGAQAC